MNLFKSSAKATLTVHLPCLELLARSSPTLEFHSRAPTKPAIKTCKARTAQNSMSSSMGEHQGSGLRCNMLARQTCRPLIPQGRGKSDGRSCNPSSKTSKLGGNSHFGIDAFFRRVVLATLGEDAVKRQVERTTLEVEALARQV
eukprot:CAMPEP_0203912398 /NCGR_PEP_ID=MMETSP0359-20131031/53482_1 /ASSEMBLY_ACC=CAM_ASM_000338 /TAXON_ID=268821 /ORGANISM="Scrippsiella Hangoei, Strain SHTV-5" /LENGTH=143 /DNA_ID=CAMNT_0050838327 /DNA_START=139 /DNA_END=567 /DNA_ORIENTATION=-